MAKNYLTVEHGLVFGEGENEVEIETDFIAQEILENFYDDWQENGNSIPPDIHERMRKIWQEHLLDVILKMN